MTGRIIITGISDAEKAAKEILEHIQAIKDIQRRTARFGSDIQIVLDSKEEPEMATEKETAPAWLEQERRKWLRFELVTDDQIQIAELNAVLDKARLTRRELAVIVASLRVRPGFVLKDFDT